MVSSQGDFSPAGQSGLNDAQGAQDSVTQAVSPSCLNPMGSRGETDGTEARVRDQGTGGAVEGDGGIEPGGEERASGIKVIPDVSQPTQEELEEHNATHAQYRSWCPHCVRGRGQASHHRAKDKKYNGIPEICFDYFFPSRDVTGLVVKDTSGAVKSLIVPFKGVSNDTGP